jgi:exodeoxyribonuclease VII large subunit
LGAGSLFELFLRLKAKLEAAGLFDSGKKRTLPAYPVALGLVTSLGAAALHDAVIAISRRAPHVHVVVYPCAVQGAEAPAQIVQAIELANRRAEVDTLIVCRGGGSIEDLWSFNDELVVRAIAGSALPVVCGVGHETDVTLAELAADVRAPTPTAAAELATPVQREELSALLSLAQSLKRSLGYRMDQQDQRLDRLAFRMGRPARLLSDQAGRLRALATQSKAALRSQLVAEEHRLSAARTAHRQAAVGMLLLWQQHLEHLALRLAAADPHRVLSRGYAWLTDGEGRAVTQAEGLQAGVALTAQWSDGQAQVQVQQVTLGLSEGPV